MKDTLTSANHRDFAARYLHTWGFYTSESNKKQLVYVSNVNNRRVRFVDKNQSTPNDYYEALVDKGIEFEFIPVNKGYYNTNEGTFLLTRVPARQWKRGISVENTKCAQLKDTLVNVVLSHKLLSDIFDNSALDYNNIWEQFQKQKRVSAAISPHFALNMNGGFYFFDKQVGVLKGEIIVLKTNVVFQEVTDVLRKHNIALSVVVE